ncbi:MAG: enoyl-CoA hydratase/isomerase family protein, partial [Sphingomonadales bacterium]
MNEDILFINRGQIGLITLNRPKALNALNADMCRALREKLNAWAEDDTVKAVVIQGAGDKAFCAGGDVVALYKSGMAYRDGDQTSLEWQRFFREEYRMNTVIKEFPKPYIAILDGITMGGGVGISVHGSHCVATERTMLAMPETGLGLVPDVGGGWFMPRLEGEVGMYLALTGDRLKAPETCALGITSGVVPSEQLEALISALADNASDVDGTLGKFFQEPGASKLDPH